jgi:hypothetical protein
MTRTIKSLFVVCAAVTALSAVAQDGDEACAALLCMSSPQ